MKIKSNHEKDLSGIRQKIIMVAVGRICWGATNIEKRVLSEEI